FDRVQMSMPVPAGRRSAVHALLGLETTITAANQVSSLAEIDPEVPLSVWAIAERRNEQSLLRRALITGSTASCDLCEETYPAAFVRVAHVKQRALCSDDEKRDPTNVLVACALCDIAFERGWLALDDEQHLLVSGSLPSTAALRKRLEAMAGRQIPRPLN